MDTPQTLPHPFYPPETEIIGYVANTESPAKLVSLFFVGAAAALAVILLVLDRVGSHLGRTEKLTVIWFFLSGAIHMVFEGYFVVNHSRMASVSDLLGQMWKEYALVDSRYMVSDTFVWWIEATVAFGVGPLCLLAVGLVIKSHPLRHAIQILISFGHSYGVILYYGTVVFDANYKGLTYWRPEPRYFWLYFIGLNSIWFVVPLMIIYSSSSAIAAAFKALDRMPNGSDRTIPVTKGSL